MKVSVPRRALLVCTPAKPLPTQPVRANESAGAVKGGDEDEFASLGGGCGGEDVIASGQARLAARARKAPGNLQEQLALGQKERSVDRCVLLDA